MHRRTFLSLVALPLLVVGCSRSAASAAPLRALSIDEVAARIAAHDGKTFVYDNNGKDRFEQGHLPGASWVESSEVTAAVLPANRNATLIFYCANEQ